MPPFTFLPPPFRRLARKTGHAMARAAMGGAMAQMGAALRGGVGGHAPRVAEPPLPEGARFLEGRTQPGGRRYRLYVPARHADAEAPLLVMLHGCKQTPEDFALGTAMNEEAERTGCLVLYPEQPASANAGRCWNWFLPAHQERDAGEPGELAELTRTVMREWRVEAGRVFVAGLSAGGAMALWLGALYPELFAGVGVCAGLPLGAARDMPSALAAMRRGGDPDARPGPLPPLLVMQGDVDRTVNPANADAIVAQGLAGRPGLRREVESGSWGGRRCEVERWRDGGGRAWVERWTVGGMGHAWPGGRAEGSYADPMGPAGSKLFVKFLDMPSI